MSGYRGLVERIGDATEVDVVIRAWIESLDTTRATRADTEIIAIGWATVDLEGAASELGGAWALAFDDRLLGASVRRSTGRAIEILLLEPNTEGRLAGALARRGEGPVALYLRATNGARPGRPRTRPGAGPFGPQRLILEGSPAGPFIILVGDPGSSPEARARAERVPYRVMIETDIALRPAAIADAERIAALFTDEGYPVGASAIEARLGRFSSDESTVIVADHDGEILGFIAIHVVPRLEQDESFVRIVALVVDSAVRERGIGRILMTEAERFGTDLGASFVEITAGHHRPEARHLYESLGYDPNLAAYLRKRLPGR